MAYSNAERSGWRVLRPALLFLVLAGCVPSSCIKDGSSGFGIGTDEFLDAKDFAGEYKRRSGKTALGGQSVFNGRLVFANLPRTIVDDVLPSNLRLAANLNTDFPGLHPILLLHGHQTNTQWVFPWGTTDIGSGYQELIVIIPFVQHATGSKWHNYMVRIYLDNNLATAIGNSYYGYFKELAVLVEAVTTPGTTLDVTQATIRMFDWLAAPASGPSAPFIDHSSASDLANYHDAIEIVGMPILGTLTNLGNQHVCSYWKWDLDDATVRPIKVELQLWQSFRNGMASWVGAGRMMNVDQGAFEIRNVKWEMAYPPIPCSF